jgi:hypothetical protein
MTNAPPAKPAAPSLFNGLVNFFLVVASYRSGNGYRFGFLS